MDTAYKLYDRNNILLRFEKIPMVQYDCGSDWGKLPKSIGRKGEKQMKSGNSKRQLDLYKLAQLFYEYEYFSDEKEPGTEYEVLSEIYDTLTQDSKDELLKCYDSIKRKGLNLSELVERTRVILGIEHRELTEKEMKYVQDWYDKGYSESLIKTAFNKNMEMTGMFSFEYIDKILCCKKSEKSKVNQSAKKKKYDFEALASIVLNSEELNIESPLGTQR